MANVRDGLEMEVAALRTLRDELRVKAHLFRADLRDEWAKVEKRIDVIESEIARFGEEAHDPLVGVGVLAVELLDEARKSIERIRERTKSTVAMQEVTRSSPGCGIHQRTLDGAGCHLHRRQSAFVMRRRLLKGRRFDSRRLHSLNTRP